MGLPSLHAMDRAQGARIWMASEATTIRVPLASWRSAEDFGMGTGWIRAVVQTRLEAGVEHGARAVELRASELGRSGNPGSSHDVTPALHVSLTADRHTIL